MKNRFVRESLVVAAVLMIALLVLGGCSSNDDSTGNGTDIDMCTKPPTVGDLELVVERAWEPKVSPDGTMLAYLDTVGIHVMDLATSSTTTIYEGEANDLSWSPQSDKIGFRFYDSTLGTGLASIPHAGGAMTVIRFGEFDDGCVWSPSGAEFAAEGSNGIVTIQYPGGDTATIICTGPYCQGEGPSWSPDATWLAYEDGLEIMRIRRSGGAPEAIIQNLNDVTEPAWSPDGDWIAFAMQDTASLDFNVWIACPWEVNQNLTKLTEADTTGGEFGLYHGEPCWAPDISAVYLEANRGGDYGIWRVELNWL
jgi:Tol biopolymer transport system component